MADLNAFAWPVARLDEALERLARHAGLAPAPDDVPAPPAGPANGEPFALWLEAVSERVGLEIEPAAIAYADVDRFLDTTGFALLPLPAPDASRFLVLLGATRRTVRVLGPDHRCRRLRRATVRAIMCRDLEVSRAAEIDRWLEEAQIPCRRRVRARAALLRDRLGPAQLDGGWRLRLSSGASFWRQMRDRGLAGQLATLVGIHVVHYALWLLAWGAIGAGALQGRWGSGWLAAWELLLLVLVGVRSWATGLQGSLASGAGALLKRRLLLGALRLSPEEIAGDGIGRGVGRVIESEAVESLTLGSGLLGLVAGVELALTTVVLGAGAGGRPQALLLVGWVALAGLLGWGCYRRRRRWTERRLDLTHDLIEGMVGHRTRVVQQAPER